MEDKMMMIPFVTHEADMERLERTNKRLWFLCILLVLMLVGTNSAWIWYESQWEVIESTEISQSVTQDADEDGSNTFVGGDYYGETDSKDEN